MADHLLYRHWDAWNDGETAHILKTDLEGALKDLSPGPYESPVFSVGGSRGYDLSPDAGTLAFASKRVPHPAESTNSDIFVEPLTENNTDIAEASAKNRTATNEAADTCPRFSPDGRSIAYLTQRVPGYESDLWRLALMDVESGKTRLLTDRSNFDYWVDRFQWSRDGRKLYFTAEVHGETPLYRLRIEDGRIEKLLSHATIDDFDVDPGERFAVYIRRSVGEPWEVYRYDLDGGKSPKRLTAFNQSVLEEVDIRPAERLTVPGAEGKTVEVFLVKPHGFDPGKKYPLILNIHGGPQMEWLDSFRGDWQVYPGAGYIVAFPNPHGSTGYGQDYTDEIAGDYGGEVYEDIMRVADYLETLPFVDKNRMGAMGWSWGGYEMNWLLGHTNRFRCLASMMGVYDLRSMFGGTEELWFPEWDLKGTPWTSPLYEKWSPSEFVKNFKTPTLIITGEKDFRIPYTESLRLFTALQKMRVPSRLVVLSQSGHWPSWYEMAFYYLVHLDWFHQYLGGDPSPWPVEDFLRNRVFKESPKKGSS
jgi:dipeptidyl aminopeptidase/acylaminoacyl peptidase